jgi:TPR repeat protein
MEKVAYWLNEAANRDHAQAIYDLAALYRNGAGVQRDDAKAVALFAKAAASGHVDAQVEYAVALANGRGVPKNEAAAVALLRIAAERGNAIAQNRLARAYSAGFGVPADRIQAAKWHILARAAGESDFKLDLMVISLRPDERAKAESLAQAWREQIAEAAR